MATKAQVRKPITLKKGMEGLQEMVNRIQEQAATGELDQSLIDELAEAVNITVDQAGTVQNQVGPNVDQAASGLDMGPVDEAPASPEEPDGDEEKMKKVSPASSRAPMSYVPGAAIDTLQSQLPQFIGALEGGSIKKAQQISGPGGAFDELFNLSCRAILNQGGFTWRNLNKLHASSPLAPDAGPQLQKAVAAGDFAGVYLMRLAKLMMPVYAGLRRRLSAQPPATGSDYAQWKTQIGFQNLNKATMMSVAEAAIGQAINETPITFSVPFKDLSLNDAVNLKAIPAAKGFDDPLQIAVIRILTAILEGEERKILGDVSAALGAPASAPTVTGSGSGTLGDAASHFVVTSLSYAGWLGGVAGGSPTYGESGASSASNTNLSGAASAVISWPAVAGAAAYNVYYAAGAGAYHILAGGPFTANSITISTVPGSGNAPPSADVTANANGYEGLMSWCGRPTIYTHSIPNKVALTDALGTSLATGTSGITQVDAKLASLWTSWQIAPSLMVMSPTMVGVMTDKILGLNSGAMYRVELSQERGTVQGGVFVSGYVNKFAPYADGTPRYIDIIPHPYMPDGQILFLSETIPYPMARESRAWQLEVLLPYTYFPLASTNLSYPFSITVSEVLECFHPAAQSAIVGLKNS